MKDQKPSFNQKKSKKNAEGGIPDVNGSNEKGVDSTKTATEMSPDETEIMNRIRSVLNKHRFYHKYNPEDPELIDLNFRIQNKPMRMFVHLSNNTIVTRLKFPFAVQSNAMAMVALYMAEFNRKEATYAHMVMDMDEGEVMMEHLLPIEKPEQFDEDAFWRVIRSHLSPALDVYNKLTYMALGIVRDEERDLYKVLLGQALNTLKGEYDSGKVEYGITSVKKALEEAEDTTSLEEILTRDENANMMLPSDMIDFISSHSLRRRSPSQAEETADSDCDSLSMFAKTDDESK